MGNTDWDKELAKIDKQLASISDEELVRASAAPPAKPGAKGSGSAKVTPTPRVTPTERRTRGIWVLARVVAALAAAGFVLLWPYPKRCGLQLGGYLAATGAVALVGAWASLWSWRHRSAVGHLVGLAATTCGLVLAALEVLPRVGYAVPTPEHPAAWACGPQPAASPAPGTQPQGTQPQGTQPQGAQPQGTQPPVTTPPPAPPSAPAPSPPSPPTAPAVTTPGAPAATPRTTPAAARP